MNLVEENFTKNWLPKKPLTSQDLTKGTIRRSRDKALDYKYIEANASSAKNMMVFDLDSPTAEWDLKSKIYDDELLPEPNYYTVNPETNHAHVGYVIDGLVTSGTKADSYFTAIYNAMTLVIGGDRGYKNKITRNPVLQPSVWMSDDTYTLPELHAFVKLATVKKETIKDEDFIGRNDKMFNDLRKYAYSAYRRLNYNDDALLVDLHAHAAEINRDMVVEAFEPLFQKEINAVVRSVHKFVVKNFTEEAFSEIQRQRAQIKHDQFDDQIDAIVYMKEELEQPFVVIGDTLGITRSAASKRYHKWAKENR